MNQSVIDQKRLAFYQARLAEQEKIVERMEQLLIGAQKHLKFYQEQVNTLQPQKV